MNSHSLKKYSLSYSTFIVMLMRPIRFHGKSIFTTAAICSVYRLYIGEHERMGIPASLTTACSQL